MKRFVVLVATVGLAGVALTAANAHIRAAKTTICHRTASKTKPYVKQTVSGKALRDALKRPADIIPAPAGACPKTVLTATTGGRPFDVALTGNTETPAGDPVAGRGRPPQDHRLLRRRAGPLRRRGGAAPDRPGPALIPERQHARAGQAGARDRGQHSRIPRARRGACPSAPPP